MEGASSDRQASLEMSQKCYCVDLALEGGAESTLRHWFFWAVLAEGPVKQFPTA